MVTTRAPVGNVAVLDVAAASNQGCKTVVPNPSQLDTTFAYYMFLDLGPTLRDRATGSTFQEISTSSFASTPIKVPPLDEQRAIVRFLDRKSRRIARFIRTRQRLIALLDEQKQAIIHQAVTRGLDPNVPLKPSGVDWLGDIPAHWNSKRVKEVYREVDERSITGQEEMLSVSHLTGVSPRSQKNVTMFMAESNVGHKFCHPADLVVNTMWAWMGALGIAKESGIVSPSYGVYHPEPTADIDPKYADLLFRQRLYVDEYNRLSTGITSSRARLYPDQLLRMPITYPPRPEQEHILVALEIGLANINARMKRYQQEIELLREYQVRLIADVVTGQLDIRDHPDAAEGASDDDDETETMRDILGADEQPEGDEADDLEEDGNDDR